jgi:catechol 2,3-dioxygenase-like lactoylglutathione lyase family enzyme
MSTVAKAYIEHVAVWVKDIHWHIRFFREVLGMEMREVQGPADDPAQYWALGGMQFIAAPDFAGPEGRLGHLGVMCEDQAAAIAAALERGATPMSQGPNWLRLPDGLALELIQARPAAAVAQALAVNPRTQA